MAAALCLVLLLVVWLSGRDDAPAGPSAAGTPSAPSSPRTPGTSASAAPGGTAAPTTRAPSPTRSGARPSGVDLSGPTAVDARVPSAALCEVTGASLRQIASGGTGRPNPDSLRDGLGLLDERLAQVEITAEGRPPLARVLTLLGELRFTWGTALTAHDAGQAVRAEEAMVAGERLVSGMDAAIAAAVPGLPAGCPR